METYYSTLEFRDSKMVFNSTFKENYKALSFDQFIIRKPRIDYLPQMSFFENRSNELSYPQNSEKFLC